MKESYAEACIARALYIDAQERLAEIEELGAKLKAEKATVLAQLKVNERIDKRWQKHMPRIDSKAVTP